MLLAQCGDREALERLLRSLEPPLRRYLSGLVGSSDTDDVLQDVLILIYRKLRWLHDPQLLRPWAFRIASRAGVRHLKKRRKWRDHFDDDAPPETLAALDVAGDDGRIGELLAVHQVSPACSAVLLLHFAEQMPLADVATVLELPLGTVKSRLAYGLAALRKQMSK